MQYSGTIPAENTINRDTLFKFLRPLGAFSTQQTYRETNAYGPLEICTNTYPYLSFVIRNVTNAALKVAAPTVLLPRCNFIYVLAYLVVKLMKIGNYQAYPL